MYRFCLVILFCLTAPLSANADIIIDVQDATIAANGLGFVDVMISSTGTDDLATYSYEFQIVGSQLNGSLEFRDASNQLPDTALGSSYVFDHDSSGIFYVNVDPTTIQGFDFTASNNNVSVSGPFLLAHLAIEHHSATPLAAVGDIFSVVLTNIGGLTTFTDNTPNPLNYATGSDPTAFTNSGTIIISSAAVPEPGTIGVLSLAAAAYIGRRRRRKGP